MANTTNYNWETPDDTDLVKDGASAIRSLGTAIDTTVFNNASAAIAKTIVDAKGDIIAATAADTVARLAVGTDGQVLKANSATATGLEWATDASGMTNPMTTTGDTIYSSSGSTPARLGIGSSGQVLTVSAGVPSWATPSAPSYVGVSLTPSTGTQTINNGTWTTVAFGNEVFDTNSFHDNTTNNSRITIPSGKGGKYLITIQTFWANNATGSRDARIALNGSDVDTPQTGYTPNSNNNAFASTNVISLTAGDYIELRVRQDSGGALSLYAANSTFFTASYLGA